MFRIFDSLFFGLFFTFFPSNLCYYFFIRSTLFFFTKFTLIQFLCLPFFPLNTNRQDFLISICSVILEKQKQKIQLFGIIEFHQFCFSHQHRNDLSFESSQEYPYKVLRPFLSSLTYYNLF